MKSKKEHQRSKFSEFIKSKREQLGLTQLQLADKTKVSQTLISKLESGSSTNLSVSTLISLSDSLNCPTQSLINAYIGK